MKCSIDTKKGFTLLEVMVVMVLVGIAAIAAGMGLVQVVQGMVFTKMNAATIQKGQIAMTRLVKEFSNISEVKTAGATSFTFTSYKDSVSSSHTAALAGSTITLDSEVLTDQVSDLTINYYPNYDSQIEASLPSAVRIIEITLGLKGANNVISEFKERVKPRNL